MAMTVTKSEGVTMFTVTSNPNSRWPLLCQILGTLCCGPFCFRSQSMKQHLGSFQSVLGTLQVMVGIVIVIYRGFIFVPGSPIRSTICLAAVFIASGIICIIADKFPSPCTINFAVLLNVVSLGLAVYAIVIYTTFLVVLPCACPCALPGDSYGYKYRYYETTLVPTTTDDRVANCERFKQMLDLSLGRQDIMMILLSILQFCLTVSSCLLGLKALCMKKKEDNMEDPLLKMPHMDEVISSPAC